MFPLGLAYVAACTRQAGHKVEALDLLFSDDLQGDIKAKVEAFAPDVVGLSLRNVDNVAYPKMHSYVQEYTDVVSAVRQYTDAPLVLGGSGFTLLPEEFMSALGADYGIRGEGETAFPKLLEELDKAAPMPLPLPEKAGSLDEVTPLRGLFNADEYYRLGGALNIQTKRGCPFGCVYCTYPMVEGTDVRLREPTRVVQELQAVVKETGVRHFFFVDSTFNHPIEHAEAICLAIIKEKLKEKLDIKWSCYCTPASMTTRLAGLMAEAGCTGVEFGSDSMDDQVLKTLGKGFDFGKIREVSEACRSVGLKFCHFVFAGAPGDTMDSVMENFKRLDNIAPSAAIVMAGIRVFPGTGIEEMVRRENPGFERPGLKPVFYVSPEVLQGMGDITREVSRRRNWVMPGFDINISERIQKKLREAGMKGSLWEGLSQRLR